MQSPANVFIQSLRLAAVLTRSVNSVTEPLTTVRFLPDSRRFCSALQIRIYALKRLRRCLNRLRLTEFHRFLNRAWLKSTWRADRRGRGNGETGLGMDRSGSVKLSNPFGELLCADTPLLTNLLRWQILVVDQTL